jgi:hypothetical protein
MPDSNSKNFNDQRKECCVLLVLCNDLGDIPAKNNGDDE